MLRRDRRNEKGVGDRPEVLCTLPPPTCHRYYSP